MNKPLIDSANMPGFEKPIDLETQAKDEEYDKKKLNATPEGTKALQQEAFKSMYGGVNNKVGNVDGKSNEKIQQPKSGDFMANEKGVKKDVNNLEKNKNNITGESKNSSEKQQDLEKQLLELKKEENPHTPLIEGFVKKGFLSLEEAELVKNALVNTNEVEKSIDDIKGLDSKKKKQIVESIKYLDKKESKKINQEHFNKDFENEVGDLKQDVKGSKKGEKELVGQNKDLIDMLGGNYFPIGKEGTKQEKEEALDVAFKTTLNQLMDGKNFKRPETFDQMKSIVKNPELDFKTRFKELKKIDNIIKLDQAKKSSSQKKNYDKIIDGEQTESQDIQERFNDIKLEVKIAIENKDFEQLKNLQEELNQMKNDEGQSGEVFEGGDIDKLIGEAEQALKEQA